MVFTWLPSVHTKRRCAGIAKRKATWTGCTVLRLTLLQRVTLQPLVPHQIRSLQRGPTTSKGSQNKRITLVGTNTCLNTIQGEHSPPFTITLYINDTPVEIEVDTGAAVSTINEATFQRLQQSSCAPTLEPANSKLKTYTGHDIAVLVKYEYAGIINSQSGRSYRNIPSPPN